jgi:hypothetical protein
MARGTEQTRRGLVWAFELLPRPLPHVIGFSLLVPQEERPKARQESFSDRGLPGFLRAEGKAAIDRSRRRTS